MSPLILVAVVITFLACFFLHIIWWRLRHPKGDIFALASIFFFIPAIFLVVLYILHVSLINLLSIALLHTALSCAYIMSYPAVQSGCPSLNILLIVYRSMPEGISEEEIKRLLGGDALLEISVQKMAEEGLTREMDNEIIPTKFGNLTASFFILFRSFLGLKQGSG